MFFSTDFPWIIYDFGILVVLQIHLILSNV